MPDMALTFHDLKTRGINYSRRHIEKMIQAGTFPAPFALSPHRNAWLASVIDAWLLERASTPKVKQRLYGAAANSHAVARADALERPRVESGGSTPPNPSRPSSHAPARRLRRPLPPVGEG